MPAAETFDRAALDNDPGAYPAANDLAILLGKNGDLAGAEELLEHAIRARPDYALGWFNLGVIHSQMGPLHLLQSQGAFSRAIALDDAFRNAERRLTMDTRVYRTGLDLSKPLPGNWSFTSNQPFSPTVSAGLLAVLLAAVGLARRQSQEGSAWSDQALDGLARASTRIPLISRTRPWAWAFLATAVVFLIPILIYHRDYAPPPWSSLQRGSSCSSRRPSEPVSPRPGYEAIGLSTEPGPLAPRSASQRRWSACLGRLCRC